MKKDSRRHQRLDGPGVIEVAWTDSAGQPKFTRAKCLDISNEGARIECPEAIPLRTYATLRAARIKLSATASVRHCARLAGKYVIGLEFSAPIDIQSLLSAAQS